MKAKMRYKMTDSEKEAMNDEIMRQLRRIDEQRSTLFDAVVLLVLYRFYGFRKRRLRKFWDYYEIIEQELQHYYDTLPVSQKGGELELRFYALEELKNAGVDVSYWRKSKKNWSPETDECWRSH